MTTQEHSQAGPDKIHRKAEKPNNHQTPDLDLTKIPVSTLKGVGSEKTALLAKLKIETITDLLLHRPKRYEDRTCLSQIKDLALDEHASVHGEIITCGVKYRRGRSMSVFEAVVEDASGRLRCRWWNMPFLKKIYTKGHRIFVYGKPNNLKPRTMDHPETEFLGDHEENSLLHLNRIVPVYGLTEGIQQRWLRGKFTRQQGLMQARWLNRISRIQKNIHSPTNKQSLSCIFLRQCRTQIQPDNDWPWKRQPHSRKRYRFAAKGSWNP